MRPLAKTLFLLTLFNIAGCNLGQDDEYLPPLKPRAKGEHVETLTQAKLVEQVLSDEAQRQRESINQQSQ